jgi:FixJ family two-component response regulator
MKQRPLTPKQRKLMEMQQAGATDHAIAAALHIHVGTVRQKRAALHRGISKGVYSDIDSLPANRACWAIQDLFAESGDSA